MRMRPDADATADASAADALAKGFGELHWRVQCDGSTNMLP
jgi:hypothetical protein